MIGTMRSNDILWGFPYDVNGFTLIQKAIASILGVELGTYIHNVGSLHAYESTFDSIKSYIEDDSVIEHPEIVDNFKLPKYASLEALQDDLRKFWIAERELRTQFAYSELVNELPDWLRKCFDVVAAYVNEKVHKEYSKMK